MFDQRTRLSILLISLQACFLAKAQTCISFGIDFVDGGSYFQNSLSSDNFTFVSEYEGCNNDVANNILVDPSGDEYLCTDTPLQPPDTPELSTCPIEKNQLVSGDWSILIISNNGNGDPIAYERDFSLSVGPQQTTTFTPTVTLSSTTTPVVIATSTTTNTAITVLPPVTVTSPAVTVHPSTTVTPKTSTSTIISTLATLTLLKDTLTVAQIVSTKTASCTLPLKAQHVDPTATITPTLVTAAALQTSKPRRGRRVPVHRGDRLKERAERLAPLQKRAPDQPTATVTDMNTLDYSTITVTSTATATTVTTVDVVTTTSTSTPPVVTKLSGTTVAAVVTVTAPTPIRTVTAYTIATAYKTITLTQLALVTTTVTPASAAAACTSAGGHF